ncbi:MULTISPECIES: response regulator transcription factor [Allobacillus]|nr:response regulator transcription factor [Allobacillus salarius]
MLIVEDDRDIREMTALYLKQKGFTVFTAENGDEALEIISHTIPQLILLDIEMPGRDGFEVCQEIRKQLIVPIIFISVRKQLVDKLTSFELGADDYLTKPFDFDELEARIRANIRRYHVNLAKGAKRLKYGDLEIHIDNKLCYLNGELIPLTAKEMKLLIQLAQYPKRIWSHDQLYDDIWSMDATGNIQTVKVHIRNLRKKLEKSNDVKYIHTVRGFGYSFSMEKNDRASR